MDDLSVFPCLHCNVVLDTTGGMQFSKGEVWDNIQERLLCLDCMEYVTEADIGIAQTNNISNLTQTIKMEVSHDHA